MGLYLVIMFIYVGKAVSKLSPLMSIRLYSQMETWEQYSLNIFFIHLLNLHCGLCPWLSLCVVDSSDLINKHILPVCDYMLDVSFKPKGEE